MGGGQQQFWSEGDRGAEMGAVAGLVDDGGEGSGEHCALAGRLAAKHRDGRRPRQRQKGGQRDAGAAG